MRILMCGPQGSGKTTQASLLAKDLRLPHFSTGQFLRTKAKEETKTGQLIKKNLEHGTLIPDDLVLELVDSKLEGENYQRGFVIEGNPRTIYQAKNFKHSLDFVIYLNLSDEECIDRLRKRSRHDDTEELIKKRLEVYHAQTEPMLDYYQRLNILHEVDASPPIAKIHKTICQIIGIKDHESH